MKPMGSKERKELFFQYVIFFLLTATALVGALFLTREELPGNKVDDNELAVYTEFSDFEHIQPKLISLIDTVTAETDKIASQNAGGDFSIRTAKQLIDEFNIQNVVPAQNPMVRETMKMLQLYVKLNGEIKNNEDEIVTLKKRMEDCEKDLKYKEDSDFRKEMLRDRQTPVN